jgi:hypothetical protein
MTAFHFSFRAAASWLLVSVLSGVFPAAGADAPATALPDVAHSRALEFAVPQPGTSAIQDPTPQSVEQRPPDQTPATAAPAKRHRSPWVRVAVVAAIAVGAGAAIILANHQSGKTSAPITGVTVNVGAGSPGPPH